MKTAVRIAAFALVAALQVRGDEFTLRGRNGGPIDVTTELSRDSKGRSQLSATATNNTGLPIQKITFCVTGHSHKKGCLFSFWSKGEVDPGGSIEMMQAVGAKIADLDHSVSITELQQFVPPAPRPPSKFDPIRALYVGEIGGNSGPMVREQLIAAIVNSGRFVVAKKPAEADATVDGRAESRELNRTVSSEDTFGRGVAYGSIASVGSGGHSRSQGGTEVFEDIALHLTTTSGDSIWAWDGTKACPKPKATCAVDDLAFSAR